MQKTMGITMNPVRIWGLVLVAFAMVFAADAAEDIGDLRSMARSGDAMAQFELAKHHEAEALKTRSNKKTRKERERAFEWYENAANQGLPEAQMRLSRLYVDGLGVERNDEQATAWALKAAEQGLPEAQYDIGNRRLTGTGLDQDFDIAMQFLEKAANQRYVAAQKLLGRIHFQGVVVDKDLVQAHMWFQVATLNSDVDAETTRSTKGYLTMLESIMDEAQIQEANSLLQQWQADHAVD
jgi:TPR repeat protein